MAAAGDATEAGGRAADTLLDPGPLRGRRDARRTCIVTRRAQAPEGLIRFVLSPEGEVLPDLKARLPGRGAWVTAARASVAEAVRRRAFPRAFRTEARVPADLADQVAIALRAEVRQALALANKAGCVVAGFAKVEAAIGDRTGVSAVIHAADASADGRRKLHGALRRRLGDAISGATILDDLSNDELDMALGRDHVIHAALVAGVGSAGCLARWRRLRAFEGVAAADEAASSAPDGETAGGFADDDVTNFAGAKAVAGARDDGNPQGSG